MSFLPTITLLDGTLRENETIELYADFTGDSLAHLHPFKSWTVFQEKNIKYSAIQERYYYLTENDGEVFTATNSDNVQIKKLKPGRLFAIFEYRDYYGVWKEVVKTFNIVPVPIAGSMHKSPSLDEVKTIRSISLNGFCVLCLNRFSL